MTTRLLGNFVDEETPAPEAEAVFTIVTAVNTAVKYTAMTCVGTKLLGTVRKAAIFPSVEGTNHILGPSAFLIHRRKIGRRSSGNTPAGAGKNQTSREKMFELSPGGSFR